MLVVGQDVKEFTADSLMRYISMVFQNVYLFYDTIENNIRFGNPDATHEQVVEAAKRGRCHAFFSDLPQGYGTVVEKVVLLYLAAKNSRFPLHVPF